MRGFRAFSWAAWVLCFAGCATETPIRHQPLAVASRAEKIDLKIELLLSDAFRTVAVSGDMGLLPFRFLLGDALSRYAEGLATTLFREVEVSEGVASGDDSAQAVLTPAAGSLSFSAPTSAFSSALVTFDLAWTLTDLAGNTIWQDRVVGEARGRWGDGFGWKGDLRRFVEEAVHDAFRNSFRVLSEAEHLLMTSARGEG